MAISEVLNFMSSLLFALPSIWNFSLYPQSKKFPVGKNKHIQYSIFIIHHMGENRIYKARILVTRSACWLPSNSSAPSLLNQSFPETRPFIHHLRILGTFQLSVPLLHKPIVFPLPLLLAINSLIEMRSFYVWSLSCSRYAAIFTKYLVNTVS